jgi:16S rRNA (uracil1498-N3)-methyltransferase
MLPRFHAPVVDPASREATLGDEEGRHLTRVMRLGVGDEVAVFDGRGREFRARVRAVARAGVTLDLLEPLPSAPEPRVPLTLVMGVLKGERMDAAVRDATMLGVRAIVPVVSAHVAVKAATLARSRPAERWRRVALASAKQCRRATLPDILDPQPLHEWLATPGPGERLLFVEPSHVTPWDAGQTSVAQPFRAASESGASEAAPASTRRTLHDWLNRPAPQSASLIVGPEGGWATAEVEAAIAAGCTPVTLGALTLRADAVPVVAIGICRFVFERDADRA